ncbi:MAG TPA: hypothetical protein VEA18_00600 [Candidatus Kapabacteria bacterium]|nr:hypothetical protein [Candidatus Kapabacteria bacterium]
MVRITEVSTLLTDYLLGATGLFFGYHVWNIATLHPNPIPLYCWAITFFLLAAAAIIGGTYHGFHESVKQKTAQAMWRSTVYLAALASCTLLLASAFSTLHGVGLVIVLAFSFGKCGWTLLRLQRAHQFRVVIYDYALSLAGLVVVYSMWSSWGVASWMLAGTGVMILGSVVQLCKVTPHRHFNHNDLYHVFQIIALCLFYTGVRAWAFFLY